MERIYSISELAREFEVTSRTIRYYEDEGLIAPARDGQKRVYSAGDRVRLALVLRGKRLGFSLAEAKDIIELYSAPHGEAGQLRALLSKLDAKRELLEEKRRDLDVTIANMDRYAERCREQLHGLENLGREAAE
ncbi:MAG: MerR family DNA-binding transcriptional regulator [Alphaproteobacteria bacterium]|nr:MerR family DNA-binding transcriptional regulator [Alphaproteobacteria bacterium]